MKYFTYKYKKSANLGKIYLLPETDKRLNSVPGRPVISNCGAPAEKASEFLHFHLKRFMKNGASYINDSNKFIKKIKKIDISNDALLVTAAVAGLYPSIPHEVGIKALRNALGNRNYKEIPTENLIKMAYFVSKTITLNLIVVVFTNFGYCYRDQICSTVCVYFYKPTLK